MRKRQIFYSLAALIAISAFVSGCRPSQQTRRTNTTNPSQQRTGIQPTSSSAMVDSLVMVQNKLVSVIDTMADVLIESRHRIRDLEMEVSRLRSMIDAERKNTGSTYLAPPQNFTAPPIPPAPSPTPPGSQTPQTTPETDPNGAPPATPMSQADGDKYGKALRLFNSGKYEEALAAFDELSHSSTQSSYIANFIYWRGESQYALGSYEDAIASFHEVLDTYPSSGKSDDAQFKIGSSYEKLSNKTNAKAAYNRLLLSYPESEYASRAKVRLQKLK